jgi:hypothetical protein
MAVGWRIIDPTCGVCYHERVVNGPIDRRHAALNDLALLARTPARMFGVSTSPIEFAGANYIPEIYSLEAGFAARFPLLDETSFSNPGKIALKNAF